MASRGSRAQRKRGITTSNLMLAPMVMWMRMPLLTAEAQAGPGGLETAKAVSEKTMAAAQGAVAAQISLFGSAMRFWPEVMSGKTPSMLSGAAAQEALDAALQPAGRRVKANFRRLSRHS